jgi:predicted glycosyltransferase
MGMNTTMIVLNDAVHAIAEDKEFGAKVADAILRMEDHRRYRPDHGIDISSNHHVNAATVVETHHADNSVLLAVGGNCVTVLGSVPAYRHNTRDIQEALLRMLADKLGYVLTDKADAEHASEY